MLLSEDLQEAMFFDETIVINPFRTSIAEAREFRQPRLCRPARAGANQSGKRPTTRSGEWIRSLNTRLTGARPS
jgi:hypothetical protein